MLCLSEKGQQNGYTLGNEGDGALMVSAMVTRYSSSHCWPTTTRGPLLSLGTAGVLRLGPGEGHEHKQTHDRFVL